MAESMPKVTISEFSFKYPTRKPMKAPRQSVIANIAGIASVGPNLSCRSKTTIVENDIIDPTERSRFPPITTKVTPKAMTPRMADDRITPNTLSTARNRSFAIAKPIMNSTKATKIPCRAKSPPTDFFVSSAMKSSSSRVVCKIRPRSFHRRSLRSGRSCSHCLWTQGTLSFR